MTNDALEKVEAGGVVMAKKDWCKRRRFWKITLLLSIAVMAISLLVFYLTGKPNNMKDSTAYVLILIAYGAAIEVNERWNGHDGPPLEEMRPAERAGMQQAVVMLICLVTLGTGKIVEVFVFTMSNITSLIALGHLFYQPADDHDFDLRHFWFTVGLGTLMGLICLLPNLFFFFGWFSIFILTYVFIVRYNFPDKTLVEVFSFVSEVLNSLTKINPRF